MKMKSLLGVGLALVLGCNGGEGQDAELCEHITEGPSQVVSGSASPTATVQDNHTRYDVTLADGTGGKTGKVSFAAAAAGDYVIGLNADVLLAVKDGAGTAVAFEEVKKEGNACAALVARYLVPLGVGTYTLELGPTSAEQVGMVIEKSGAH
jgi:hypothetical protein